MHNNRQYMLDDSQIGVTHIGTSVTIKKNQQQTALKAAKRKGNTMTTATWKAHMTIKVEIKSLN